jgi:transcriptional regulator GlxA family with amidase domain
MKILVPLFPDFESLDVFGPVEMFGTLGEFFSIEFVAATPGPIASAQRVQAFAEHAFTPSDVCDILLVPGGIGTRREVGNTQLLEWLRITASRATYVASVCTGSALLARAGILDGRRATSNKKAFDWVVSQGPNVHWQRSARWVADGNFFTSSGVSAGMDMALALIANIHGEETANFVARHTEYLWQQDPDNDPFPPH